MFIYYKYSSEIMLVCFLTFLIFSTKLSPFVRCHHLLRRGEKNESARLYEKKTRHIKRRIKLEFIILIIHLCLTRREYLCNE